MSGCESVPPWHGANTLDGTHYQELLQLGEKNVVGVLVLNLVIEYQIEKALHMCMYIYI